MKAIERFLSYIKYDTQSDENSGTTPSSEAQRTFAEMLCAELKAIGADNASVDGNGYVTCKLPATAGREDALSVGFIAHMDTAPDFSGRDVKAQIIENYDGGMVPLGSSGLTLDPAEFSHLTALKGRTLITTDGTTLLGADDKAGVAEIMTVIEKIISENIPHGPLSFCFTPDEEIGEGADHFDAEAFATVAAYTVDGGAEGEIEYENFNAYSAKFEITGRNIHPGGAKNMMINASLVAHEIVSMLPSGDTPENTEGYEGFYHLCGVSGTVEKASLDYIVRDHDADMMRCRLKTLRHIEKLICEKYGDGTAVLTVKEQYRNMREIVENHMYTVDTARAVISSLGITPVTTPVRGGTDGARISFMGIPCPNLGTGGYAFHGPFEHITSEGMEKAVDIILGIISAYKEMKL
ncbi:MAG: peptidase T [Clostridia bacterium]|nr:peptidase T [Clostridia bacterium]